MLNEVLNLNEKDRNYKGEIENFAKNTLKNVESRSKIFGIMVNQIADESETRK